MAYTVYKHTSPSGKVYIGITSRPVKKRWRNGNGYKLCPYFWRAIQKYGWENIEHEILYEGLTEEEAFETEIRLIKEYDATNPEKGYNELYGGQGGCHSTPLTEEQRKRMSETTKKLWEDPSFRESVVKSKTGTHLSLEAREKMSAARKGKKKSAEMRRKLSEARKGVNPFLVTPMTPEWREKLTQSTIERCSKPILQFTKDGEFVAEYPSAAEAARTIGANGSCNISTCALGKLKSAYGFVWKYKEQLNGN